MSDQVIEKEVKEFLDEIIRLSGLPNREHKIIEIEESDEQAIY